MPDKNDSSTVRLKVTAEIARIIAPAAPRDVQLEAARGALPLAGKDLLTVLFLLCGSQDAEIRKTALISLKKWPSATLGPMLTGESLHPRLLDLLARIRMNDVELMNAVVIHPDTSSQTLLTLAAKGPTAILDRLAAETTLLEQHPQLVEALIANPAAGESLKTLLGGQEPERLDQAVVQPEAACPTDEEVDVGEGRGQTELDALMLEAEQEHLSKYQIALQLEVADKIKMAMIGDKEWRTILIKETNKLVQAAVMKNPRITDGEVLQMAKNKSSSDEIIRLILLNKEWLKNYEIRKALVTHPKTPLPKALRFVGGLAMKDIKDLARSRQVSNIIANAARRELEQRVKKTGG